MEDNQKDRKSRVARNSKKPNFIHLYIQEGKPKAQTFNFSSILYRIWQKETTLKRDNIKKTKISL
jgi:hypothetical protein